MRIACVSDIHGNLSALEAVLDDIDRLGVAEFTDDERQQLRDLPPTVSLPEAPTSCSTTQDRPTIWTSCGHSPATTRCSPFSVSATKPSSSPATITPNVCHWQGRTMCICGSVGLTIEGNGARYLILERRQAGWEPQHRSVDYDVERVLQRFVETDYIGRTGPMGRLFVRHVATGTEQVVPSCAGIELMARSNLPML